ncbi:DNA/RNA non-specific endonuclease [Latilactobacillus fuchuensis]|uniref:Prophage nuclease n=1 Tax=Latilactobacillus fuchuensis TaxID=164393 RepID=A0A2N9DV12_9LACO|nr:DNA/RNA non-specific endonuclease [Latilactobacillus fuchuensis]MCP8857869.1 DNA/RNA non-specific endonuclease [Latilactobacillus fuchuensis]SPC38280.1 Prophage nuclease [Latilactobacillus fuchuensis]
MTIKKQLKQLTIGLALIGCVTLAQPQPTFAQTKVADLTQKEAHQIEVKNRKNTQKLTKLQKKINQLNQKIAKLDQKLNTTPKTKSSTTELAALQYTNQNEIVVNNNQPTFNATDLATTKGAWQTFSDLDQLNRVGSANALLNKSLMPTAKREGLTWNPTGWHNKRISSGWLYNRSHLIGYQLTGQNNNPKNLMTGTRQLNAPEMLAHESDIAYFLKQNPKAYVRYRVTPIFKGEELLARGVQMEGQSVGSDAIQFNVYIFNVENGVTLNYADGTSTIKK